jgi:hypothetical protein
LLDSADCTSEDALQYRLQYEAPDKLPGFYQSLMFYLQTCTFLSGAEGIRTHALRRAKAHQLILARPSTSSDFDILQVLCSTDGDCLSAAYQLIPARLEYGCSTFAGRVECGVSSGSCIPLWLLSTVFSMKRYAPRSIADAGEVPRQLVGFDLLMPGAYRRGDAHINVGECLDERLRVLRGQPRCPLRRGNRCHA